MYKIAPVCSGLLWELVLSLIDAVSEPVECMVEQILELCYKIFVFVSAKCNQLCVVVQMESVYHQIIIWVSCLYGSFNLIEIISQF